MGFLCGIVNAEGSSRCLENVTGDQKKFAEETLSFTATKTFWQASQAIEGSAQDRAQSQSPLEKP
jgi:hypothetical protein